MSQTVHVTVGDGVRAPQGRRVEVSRNPDSLADLLGRGLVESWWSGHLWTGDYRLKDRWERAGVIAIDVDGTWREKELRPGKKRLDRAEVPEEAHAQFLERLVSDWSGRWSLAHTTPRGARLVWILEEDLTDRGAIDGAIRLCSALAGGVIAGILVDGGEYEVDTKANADLARLYYTPTAEVGGVVRAPIGGVWPGRSAPWGVAELDDLVGALGVRPVGRRVPDARRAAVGAALVGVTDGEADIVAALLKCPCEGSADGSLELIQVCRKALGLGVGTLEVFLRVAGPWNAGRMAPWSGEALGARWVDACARWDAEGLVVGVPGGRWTRPGLEKVLGEDREFKGLVEGDLLLGETRWRGKVLDEAGLTEAEGLICRRYGWPSIPRDALFTGFGLEASRRAVDPVRAYLDGLEWDGVERLGVAAGEDGLVARMKVVVPEVALAAAYLRATLIAAVARVHRPGCKHDHVPVLIGPDRAGKSTALRALAGSGGAGGPGWFADSHIDPSNKDAYLALRGVWIYELSELDALTTRVDVARVKAFMSSQVDKYRPPYGRVDVSVPRRSVFFATSNRADLLQDPTSSRRWWVMEVERGIDVEWLGGTRDQLWAEAQVRYLAGEKWWLTTEQEEQREEVNAGYTYDGLASDDLVEAALDRRKKQDLDLSKFSMQEILKNCMPDRVDFKPFEVQKVSNSLIAKGYKRKVVWARKNGKKTKTLFWQD